MSTKLTLRLCHFSDVTVLQLFAWKYLLRAGVRGQGSGVDLRHDETTDCQITNDSAARQSRQRS